MITITCIIVSLIVGFITGRKVKWNVKNYGVTKKMFLLLEKQEIDRKIQFACDLEKYEVALQFKRKLEKIERKLKRLKNKK